MSNATGAVCPSCATALSNTYCAACGQRAPRPDDFTWGRFAREVGAEFSGGDSRIARTALGIFRPGRLTLAYVQYRWHEYLPPLRLYLVVSAAFFLLAWATYFQAQALQILEMPAEAMPTALRALYADPASADHLSDWSAGFRFAGVLVLGVLVALMHVRKDLPLGRHLVFATHYYCADYAIFLLGWPLVYFAPDGSLGTVNLAVTYGGMAWLTWWAVLADRRVYGGTWRANVARGLAVVLADIVISVVAGQLAVIAVLVPRL